MKSFLFFIVLNCLIPSALFANVDFGDIEIIDGGRDEEGFQLVGLKIDLNEGWKTYWRLAGPNGLDPVFNLSDSLNIADFEIFWQEPKLFGDENLEAIGYEGETTITFRIKPENINEAVVFDIKADIGVCANLCVPIYKHLHQKLNTGYRLESSELKLHIIQNFPDGEFCDSKFIPAQDGLYLLEAQIEDEIQVSLVRQKSEWSTEIENLRAYELTSEIIRPFKCMFPI